MNIDLKELERGAFEGLTTGKYKTAVTPATIGLVQDTARLIVQDMLGQISAEAAVRYMYYEAWNMYHMHPSQRSLPSKLFMKGTVYNP